MPTTDRKLRVFLCHSSQDKPIVRELYQRLNAEGWIDSWLDEEKIPQARIRIWKPRKQLKLAKKVHKWNYRKKELVQS